MEVKKSEIKQPKASVERANAQTDATKKKILERQAYLRELSTQIAKLQRPVPYKIQDKREEKGKNKDSKEEQKNGRWRLGHDQVCVHVQLERFVARSMGRHEVTRNAHGHEVVLGMLRSR